jgi:hypothetical protein
VFERCVDRGVSGSPSRRRGQRCSVEAPTHSSWIAGIALDDLSPEGLQPVQGVVELIEDPSPKPLVAFRAFGREGVKAWVAPDDAAGGQHGSADPSGLLDKCNLHALAAGRVR